MLEDLKRNRERQRLLEAEAKRKREAFRSSHLIQTEKSEEIEVETSNSAPAAQTSNSPYDNTESNLDRLQDQAVPTSTAPQAADAQVETSSSSSPLQVTGANPETLRSQATPRTTPSRDLQPDKPLKRVPLQEYQPNYKSSSKARPVPATEEVIYEQPPSKYLTITSAIVTLLFGFMLFNLLLYCMTLQAIGVKENTWLISTYLVSGTLMLVFALAGYSARCRLVKRITLVPRTVGGRRRIDARIEGRGWLPLTKVTEQVPVSDVYVNSEWDEFKQPIVDVLPPLHKMHWIIRGPYWVRKQLRALFFELRFKVTRQLMIKMWTSERRGVGSRWLVDAHCLVPRGYGIEQINDANGELTCPIVHACRLD
jgi:hypothetical protein